MTGTPPPYLLADAWVHDLSPYIVRLWGDFGLRWYGFAYVAGFAIAYVLMRWLAARGKVLIPKDRVADVMIWLVVGTLVGGRLGYVLFYQPSLLIAFDQTFPWWGVLQIDRGGMASHGGMIGIALAAWRVSRGFKNENGTIAGRCPALHVLDITCLLAPFGLLFGRIANFINGELLGTIVAGPGQPSPWWSVKFPQELLSDHAPQLGEQQIDRLRTLMNDHALPGDTETRVIQRIIEKIQNGSQETADQLAPLLAARHPSQLYQAFAEGVVLLLVLWTIWAKPRVPGVVGCWFLMVYGVLRVLTEIWRLPDDHLRVQTLAGLSRGQWLSVLMILVGAALLLVITKRGNPSDKLGGWLRCSPDQPAGAPAPG